MKTGVKNLILIILLAGSITVAGATFYKPGPCKSTLAYSVGRVDSQFNISKTEFREVIEEAEEIWESEVGKELFVYDPEAEYSINLIFDERQRKTLASRQIEEELENLEGAREEVLGEYKHLISQYESEKTEFEILVSEYEESLATYNEHVQNIQNQSSVTEEEVAQIEAHQAELEILQHDLQDKQVEVNDLVDSINTIARQEQSIVNKYNTTADTYQDIYGEAREFEQGHYTPNKINIYQFNQKSDLRMVLVHELGHALGIGHVNDPEAIMYHMLEHQSLEPIQLTDADKASLDEACQESSWKFI